jgi:hypothetical protein
VLCGNVDARHRLSSVSAPARSPTPCGGSCDRSIAATSIGAPRNAEKAYPHFCFVQIISHIVERPMWLTPTTTNTQTERIKVRAKHISALEQWYGMA